MFLTEREVADRLRCSLPKVKRLRLTGKLAYLPGRPPLIDEEDLASYIALAKRRPEPPPPPPPPTPEETRAKVAADAKEWARTAWLKEQMRRSGLTGRRRAVRDDDAAK
jgi:hypothetical protein